MQETAVLKCGLQLLNTMTSRFCDNLGRPMKCRILNVTMKQEAKLTAERSTNVNKQERRLLYKQCSGNSNAILTEVKQRFTSTRPARFPEFRMFLFRHFKQERLYDMIYLLTAIGLSPGGSRTVHNYTQTIHRTTQLTTLVGRLSGIRTQCDQTKINVELTA